MKLVKEMILGLYVISTAALAGQDDVITRLAIEKAKIKPEQAMEIISKQYSGSRLSEFSVDDDDSTDRMVYEFNIIDKVAGEKIEVTVDPETGNITEQERESIRSWYKKDQSFDKKKYQQLFEGTTLQEAIAEAKKVVPGVLLEAELEHEKGIVYFETELLTPKGVQKVIVDMATGRPIPIANRHNI